MKYNDNGTYKDIYVKSFDTLPVGAIVEYNGATIPTGWTDIGNNQIEKTSQYIEGGASLSTVYGTSNTDGYTQSYINSLFSGFTITPLTLTYSTSGSNIIIDYSVDDFDNGIILINGHLEGGSDAFLTTLINYGTKYSATIINIRGTNINNSQASLTNNNKALSVPSTGTVPTGIGTVKAVLIKLG